LPYAVLSTAPQKTVPIRLKGGLANDKSVPWTRNCGAQH